MVWTAVGTFDPTSFIGRSKLSDIQIKHLVNKQPVGITVLNKHSTLGQVAAMSSCFKVSLVFVSGN